LALIGIQMKLHGESLIKSSLATIKSLDIVMYPWEKDRSFAHWVARQRVYHKKEWLQLHRIKLLEQLRFRWTFRLIKPHSIKNEAVWQSKYYGKLLPFVYTHGHCNLPQVYPADLLLQNWVKHQRFLFSKGILRKDRVALLDRVGFVYYLNHKQRENQSKEAAASTDLLSSTST
jgi:hypothetical protein